ncbi:ribosome biogenesis factor YjgA [Frateuria aurantia]
MSDPNESEYGPSRSQQRRDALAMLTLAGQLVDLPPTRTARLKLPDDVRDEIVQVRRITSHIARKRQLQFLAKLMRRHGEDAFAEVRAALGENREKQRQETAAMHRLESMRDRLIDDGGDETLTRLIDEYPDMDRQRIRNLVRQARLERDKARPPKAYREIFQLLKELQATRAEPNAGNEDDGDQDEPNQD